MMNVYLRNAQRDGRQVAGAVHWQIPLKSVPRRLFFFFREDLRLQFLPATSVPLNQAYVEIIHGWLGPLTV